jgi:hypothetical protein
MRLISAATLGDQATMDRPEGTLDTSHYLQSSLREKLLEHFFIGRRFKYEVQQCSIDGMAE